MNNLELLNEIILLPILILKVKDKEEFDVFQISKKLRERGWIVPAYSLPVNASDVAILPFVIKENFNRDMADLLVSDIKFLPMS